MEIEEVLDAMRKVAKMLGRSHIDGVHAEPLEVMKEGERILTDAICDTALLQKMRQIAKEELQKQFE